MAEDADKKEAFEHCGTCPKFLREKCTRDNKCHMADDNKSSKKGDKKPVKKGTYG